MEFYSPVQVSHPVNKALKSQDNPESTRVLAQRLLHSSQNCHICHRKKHLIIQLLHFGIVWRFLIPFTRILVSSDYPKLPLNGPAAAMLLLEALRTTQSEVNLFAVRNGTLVSLNTYKVLHGLHACSVMTATACCCCPE